MRYAICLLILCAAFATAAPAHAQTIGQYTNGNRCKNYFGTDASTDDFPGNVLTARVHVRHVANTTIKCSSAAYDQFGSVVTSCGSHTYSGPITSLWLDVGGSCTLNSTVRMIAIWCEVPEDSYIDMYEYYMAP
jgi:hypothetical protein